MNTSDNIKKALLSSIICNMIVWYELTLFGVLTHIITLNFFPFETDYLGKIKFLITFSIGFCFRPIGALIFGYMGDKYGRRRVLLVSVILASISSTTIGIIPNFQTIGILAPVLLVICRIIQGIAAGGETSINSAFLIEHSSSKKDLGLLGSIKPFSGALGSLMCFAMLTICKKVTGENFELWCWRLLFHFCFIMGMIGFFIRCIMKETLAYITHNQVLPHSPFLNLIKNHKRPLFISVGLGIAQNAIVYSIIMFYNTSVTEFNTSQFDIKNMVRIISEIIFGTSAVLFGTLSDRIGRKNIMVIILLILACASIPVLSLLSHNNFYIVGLTYLIASIPIAASFGIYNSLICELFPTKVRCIGSSLAHNISAGVFGGISPSICILLIEKTNTKFIAGIYLTICALISLIAVMQIKACDKKIDW